MTWYKVLDKDCKAKDGGKFDYSPFIDGKDWTPEISETKLCEAGYHVTPYWNMFYSDNTLRVFEVEVKGILEQKEVGVNDKAVGTSIRFVKEIEIVADTKSNTGYRNTGDRNTGDSNTGDRNTGHWNTGHWNTGNRNTGNSNTGHWNTGNRNTGNSNTGHWNTGDRNTGDSNTGHWNTGDRNTGDSNTGDSNTGNRNTGHWNTGNRNTGNSNTGHWNTGDSNTGDSNTGNWNTGHWNTGNWNTGDRNTGHWNTGSNNTGSLNTKRPKITQLFDKDILISKYEKIIFPDWFFFEIQADDKDLKKSWALAFSKATADDLKKTIRLPNFDYKVFQKISGITKKQIIEKLEG